MIAAPTGEHTQSATGRALTYWATFDTVSTGVCYAAVIMEGPLLLGTSDFTVDIISVAASPEVLVREHLLAYIEAMRFGKGKAPQSGTPR